MHVTLLITLVLVWLGACCAVRGLLDSLRHTSLLKHIMNTVRRVFKNTRSHISWPVEPDDVITSEQWRTWWLVCSRPLPVWLADLATCPRCQAHHLGYLFGLLLLPFYASELSWIQASSWLTFMFFSVPYGVDRLAWRQPNTHTHER